MTLTLPDFSALTAVQFVGILLVVAAVDFVTGVYGALVQTHTFTWQQLPAILETHGVFRVVPIGGLFAVGVLGNVPAMCGIADAFLAAYTVETLQSAYSNLQAPKPAA